MPKDVLVVFTFKHIQTILNDGGTQSWALKPGNARRCRYVVCTRNRYHEGAGPEEHGAAFLIGKVSTVETSPNRPDRFIVRFDEYALLDPQPVVWPGARNPVWYVDSLSDLQIDEGALQWQPVPEGDETEGEPEVDSIHSGANSHFSGRLTAPAARIQLAETYGVSPENVEITIRL